MSVSKKTDFMDILHRKTVASNPFHTSASFHYPLKTSKNQKFSDVFRGNRNKTAWNGFNCLLVFCKSLTLHKKLRFPLKISSGNGTKSAVSCGLGHIYWSNSWWKTSFFCAVLIGLFWFNWKKPTHELFTDLTHLLLLFLTNLVRNHTMKFIM